MGCSNCKECKECFERIFILGPISDDKNVVEYNLDHNKTDMVEDSHLESPIMRETKNVKLININIILIDDRNSKNKEISSYLKSSGIKNILPFSNITDAINKIKEIFFEETIIIVNGKLSLQFIKDFKENLKEIYTIPKIVIFEKDKNNFLQSIEINNLFYYSNIKTNPDEIKDFILNLNNQIIVKERERNMKQGNDDGNLVFEYIDSKEKLLLPIMYKSLIELNENDKVEDSMNF